MTSPLLVASRLALTWEKFATNVLVMGGAALTASLILSCEAPEKKTSSPEDSSPTPVQIFPVESGAKIASLTNSVDMSLLWCAQGAFAMGSPSTERFRMKDEAQIVVELRSGFWMGATEVTQAQWKTVMGDESNPSSFPVNGQHPVENVTWQAANAFCDRLTEREREAGLLPEGWAYGLPTEAQWEYACRAGTETSFAGEIEEMAWHEENSFKSTHDAGQLAPNAWGFYDMHGNVWEWCRDYYDGKPYSDEIDPTGPAGGTEHVMRGGAWSVPVRFCRSAFRAFPGRLGSLEGLGTVGFRVVLEQSKRSGG